MKNYNEVTMSGKIKNVSNVFLAKNGTICVRCNIQPLRLSGNIDTIPLLITDKIISRDKLLSIDNNVLIKGHVRTVNQTDKNNKLKLVQYVYVESLVECDPEELSCENTVKLTGTLCRKPQYRHTPLGRLITDIMLAHNPDNKHVSYYIPCVVWGTNGINISNLNVGDTITITGRYQSREYSKLKENGEIENYVALEVSVISYEEVQK